MTIKEKLIEIRRGLEGGTAASRLASARDLLHYFETARFRGKRIIWNHQERYDHFVRCTGPMEFGEFDAIFYDL